MDTTTNTVVTAPAAAPTVGDAVLSFWDDEPRTYGGVNADGAVTLRFQMFSGQRPVRHCPADRVAPADVAVPAADARVSVRKLAVATYYGAWLLELPGMAPDAFKRKRDAVAAGLRRLAILDHVAAR
jgi:hypothetical protein